MTVDTTGLPTTDESGVTSGTIPRTVLFPDRFDKRLVATFDRQHARSDGGAVLLKKRPPRVPWSCSAAYRRPSVCRMSNPRLKLGTDPCTTLTALLGQRILGMACGHPDGTDGDHLADDRIS